MRENDRAGVKHGRDGESYNCVPIVSAGVKDPAKTNLLSLRRCVSPVIEDTAETN